MEFRVFSQQQRTNSQGGGVFARVLWDRQGDGQQSTQECKSRGRGKKRSRCKTGDVRGGPRRNYARAGCPRQSAASSERRTFCFANGGLSVDISSRLKPQSEVHID